jgi:hypothetical protein
MKCKIPGHHIEEHRTLAPEDLRRVFESAVCELHEADLTAKKRLPFRSPIVPRQMVLGTSQADVEKRALSDAARALAELWKVYANPTRGARGKAAGITVG